MDDLAELSSDISLKLVFCKKTSTDFCLQVLSEYSGLTDVALKNLLQFSITHNSCGCYFQQKLGPNMRIQVSSGTRRSLIAVVESKVFLSINSDIFCATEKKINLMLLMSCNIFIIFSSPSVYYHQAFFPLENGNGWNRWAA